jgi:uncharacterized protein YlxW (UPF0749 family)
MKRKHSINFKHLILSFLIAMFIFMFLLSTIAQTPSTKGKAKDSESQLQGLDSKVKSEAKDSENPLQKLDSRVKDLEDTVKNKLSFRNRALNWVIPVAVVIICLFVYQRFIKNRIRRPVKRETEKGSLLLRVDDLENIGGLAVQLQNSQNPLSQYLRGKFSDNTRLLLNKTNLSRPETESLKKALVDELNQLLQGDCLYDEQRFAKVQLTKETQMRVKQNPQGEDLIRLNRLLLEESYPNKIATSSGRDGQEQVDLHLLQRQSTLNQDVSQIREQLGSLRSQFDEMSKRQTNLEETVEGMNKNQKTPTGVGIWLLPVESMKVVVSEVSQQVKTGLVDILNENLQKIPIQDSIVQVINSEVIPKLETTILSKFKETIEPFVTDWKGSISEVKESLDMLPDRIREEKAQKPPIPEGKVSLSSPVKKEQVSEPQITEIEPAIEVDEAWKPFFEFTKQYFDSEQAPKIERCIKQVLSEKRDPATVHDCFKTFAQMIGVIYRRSTLHPEDLNLNDFHKQFENQLKLQIYGLDVERRQWKDLTPRPKMVPVENLELENPQRKIYDMKLKEMRRSGEPQPGQVIAVLSPGIKSTYRSDWDIPPEVAVYGGNK